MDSAVSQPNLGPSNKSASRIREMLESVRGRMAAVVNQSSVSSTMPGQNTLQSKIPNKSNAILNPLVTSNVQKNRRILRLDLVTKQAKMIGRQKSGNDAISTATGVVHNSANVISSSSSATSQRAKSRTDEREFQMNLLRTLEDIQCNVEFLRDKLTNEFETTRERLADYLSENPAKLNLHDCLCNLLTFGRHFKEVTEELDCRKRNLNVSKEKCTLKRSSTINSRLPSRVATRRTAGDRMSAGGNMVNLGEACNDDELQTNHDSFIDGNRASFGGYRSSEQRQSSIVSRYPQHPGLAPSRSMAPSRLVRTSSTCSSMVKSSLSSLSSQATTGANTSSGANTSDHDDLHDGLMKLLNETNSRRNSDKMRLSTASSRRFSGKLIDI